MNSYLKVLDNILSNGVKKPSGRKNMPDVLGISGAEIVMDLNEGFPLLTTKQVHFKSILHELIWFLKGNTNIKYLIDNGVSIWNEDAYRYYKRLFLEEFKDDFGLYTFDEFVDFIREGFTFKTSIENYELGDCGKIYGHQWRNQNGVDQILDVIEGLINNPYSRYHIIDTWNKADFNEMALPPCHLLYQFTCRPEENDIVVDLTMYQRSCDMFLGVPFNLASMSLLLHIICSIVGYKPGKARWIGADVHIYEPHIPMVKKQLKRRPLKLPKLIINMIPYIRNGEVSIPALINNINYYSRVQLENYNPHPKIKAPLFTGLKPI